MQKARQLLCSTPLLLSEIANRVGYDRVDYFRTVFRRENDTSPGQYRLRQLTAQTCDDAKRSLMPDV